MTYNDGRDDDEDGARMTIFVVVLALALIMFVLLCVLGASVH